jgi:hypothetical protein
MSGDTSNPVRARNPLDSFEVEDSKEATTRTADSSADNAWVTPMDVRRTIGGLAADAEPDPAARGRLAATQEILAAGVKEILHPPTDVRLLGLQDKNPNTVVIPERCVTSTAPWLCALLRNASTVLTEQTFTSCLRSVTEIMPSAVGQDRSGGELWRICRIRIKATMATAAAHSFGSHTFKYMYAQAPRTDWLDHARSAETQCKEKKYFTHPNSKFRTYWDLAGVVQLIYVAILVPVRAGFSLRSDLWGTSFWIDVIIDLYFLSDIAVNFRTAFYDERTGNLVVDQARVSRSYLSSWFIVDFLSCLPVVYVELIVNGPNAASNSTNNVKMFKGLRLLRLAKMLRLARIKKIIERQDEAVGPMLQSFRLVGVVTLLIFVGHLFACLWYFVGEEPQRLITGEIVEYGWVQILEQRWEDSTGSNTTDCIQWQLDTTGMCVNLAMRYTVAMYWSMTTLSTVGFGDINANTENEMRFAVVVELCGGISFAILVGSLSQLLTTRNASDMLYQAKMDEVREYLRHKEVPRDQRRHLLAYFDHYCECFCTAASAL